MMRPLVLGSIVLISASCAMNDQAPVAAAGVAKAVVTGQALYRERIVLPPGSQLDVLLEDTSRTDAPADNLGDFVLANPGNPPYSFAIHFDPARIVRTHRYVVRARLTNAGRLLFATDQVYPVITNGNPTEVSLLLKTVATGSNTPPPESQAIPPLLGALPATFKGDLPCADCTAIQYQLDLFDDSTYDLLMVHRGRSNGVTNQTGRWETASTNSITLLGTRTKMQFAIINANSLRLLNQNGGPIDSNLNYTLTRDTQTPNTELTNTSWRLTRLQSQPAQRFENQREPQIVLTVDNRVTGSDGCNRITGSYRHASSDLTFAQVATTRMACMNGMEQAGRYTTALSNVARYRIAGRHLELFDSTGALLLRFEAVFVR
jgi:uncharacterized lipoprotein YbaY/heat shock protein HslJ